MITQWWQHPEALFLVAALASGLVAVVIALFRGDL